MSFRVTYWLKWSMISFLMVALLGLLMRYKIPFSLPGINQKHLLHAHSHFAFTGWISQTLYVLLIHFLVSHVAGIRLAKYRFILVANLACSYGMLFSFAAQGYAFASISFSTLSIFINYFFCLSYYKDIKSITAHPAVNWLKAALLFSVLSSAGTYYLAFMMYSKSVNQDHYLGALYFFLHFQYNGWFLFASLGLLMAWLHRQLPQLRVSPLVFGLFFWACVPSYLLSTLWAALPGWLYAFAVASAIAQFAGWVIFMNRLRMFRGQIKSAGHLPGTIILILSGMAFSIKLLLQLGSTIPSVSKLAFGFRPIVIAYLHLILLAVFSLYLLGYSYVNGFLIKNKATTGGLCVIITGVILNELVLLVQGIAAFSYTPVVFVNEILLGVAAFIFLGIGVLLASQLVRQSPAAVGMKKK